MNLIPWVATGTRYFILMKVIVRLISLITLIRLDYLFFDNASLVTPEDKFVRHAQVIMISRDQGRKLGLDISRISPYRDSGITGFHRNAIFTEGGY